ncbi:TfpX/TfpZ family type IV pilin accessory protein [Acinetobacter proteolyticus]|uniref:TfpX/TfpZ family type IV pilin accessory protein n=1 Tax=Acinetobacter proteolyticus TaxID=1776741 RepID=UPI003D976433
MSKRIRFFIGHLSISLIFIALLFMLIHFIWFIPPLDSATGILPIFFMLVIIDLFIGPMFGFLVYKEGKKTLKLDLSVVILLQVCSFAYGAHIIFEARPVWIVYNSDKYDLVQKFEVIKSDESLIQPAFRSESLFYPQYAAIKPLPNSERFVELQSGMSVVQKPERYVDISSAKSKIQDKSKNLSLLHLYNDSNLVQRILKKYPQATAFVPLKANAVDMTVLINKEKGEVVKIVDLRPWK